MFTFEIATEIDQDELTYIITDPTIWPHVTDDSAPEPNNFILPFGESLIYVKVFNEGECLGFFALIKMSDILVDFHTCLLPSARGSGWSILKEFTKWVFATTSFLRIIGNAPVINRLALKMATDAGYKEWGVNPKSFMKNGKLVDLVWVGINKGDVCLS